MLIDEVKAALENYAVYDAGDWQELVLKVLPKLIAAEELADATEMVCDQVYNRVGGVSLRAAGELRAARAAYRKAGEAYAD